MKRRKCQKPEYIPVCEENYHLFTRFDLPYWVPAPKFPIDSIKIDKSLMSFPNEVLHSQVETIVNNFDSDFWLPITLNADGFLLDGQHRLEAARQMNLKFIDTVIQNTELLNGKG